MLHISEIYPAIQGETSRVGQPCVIIRLAGCNLDCAWCDTPHKNSVEQDMSVQAAVDYCRGSGMGMVLVTGGEPLLHEDCPMLLSALKEAGFVTMIETNGSLSIEDVPEGVITILDFKCPGSGMSDRMMPDNLKRLRGEDEVKFVIEDRADFDFAAGLVRSYGLAGKAIILFSPVFGRMAPEKLAEWILESRMPIRLNLQIHKYIWEPAARRR